MPRALQLQSRLALAALVVALPAFAVDSTAWPPPGPVRQRMHALQSVMRDASASAAQREAAREELAALLKSPAGRERGRTRDEKPPRPARAAIQPFPSVVPHEAPKLVPPPDVAKVEVIPPPKPVVIPETGSAVVPSGRFGVDPQTGRVLHEVPGGYVDPVTGRFTPR